MDTFTDTENGVITKLNEYFIPKKIIFLQTHQSQGEQLNAFLTRLRHLALKCEFTDIDRNKTEN